MRRQVLFALLASCAIALAALVVYSSVHRAVEAPAEGSNSTTILVAAHDLPARAPLGHDSYKFAPWSRSSVPAGAITESAQLVDKVTKDAVQKGQPLTADRIVDAATRRDAAMSIPIGMRAIAAPVEALGNDAALLQPHARTDVLVSIGAGAEAALAQIVLQNVEILSIEPAPAPETLRAANTRVVTLLVTPEDAERLVLASHEGALSLAMRNDADHQIVRAEEMNLAELLRGSTPLTAPRTGPRRDASLTRATVDVMRNGRSLEKIAFDHDREIQTVVSAEGLLLRRGAAPQPAGPDAARGATSLTTATTLATAARLEGALQSARQTGPGSGAGYVTPNAKTVEIP